MAMGNQKDYCELNEWKNSFKKVRDNSYNNSNINNMMYVRHMTMSNVI